MQHAGFSSRNLLDPRSYEKYHFTTRVQETASLHRAGLGSCVSGVQPLKCQQTSERQQPGTVLIFDTETTGGSNKYDRIMELALRDLSGGKNSTFETLINPERVVPNYVAGLTKISTGLVRRPDVPRYVSLPMHSCYS